MISTKDLSLHTHNKAILHPLSLELAAGRKVMLLGASGSGKTLLLLTLLGVLPENLKQKGFFENTFKMISYLPQMVDALNPLLTIERHFKALSCDPSLNLLKKLRLDPVILKQKPHELSGGMAKRVMAMLSLGIPFDCLFADEPTIGLDSDLKDIVMKEILEKTVDKGLLLVTHDWLRAFQLGDDIYILNEGKLVEVVRKEDNGDFELRSDFAKRSYELSLKYS